ncbi:hypothetical protein KP12_236 [Klebsiella phage KP12]|uniref:Uncharacterized protein n=1 Tax=Klebsiella phage KP12 TaxID=2923374 RepID=A0A9E7CL96_9CAUD|nr:hypothetical protein KP12_236 [Klebsiella phage KP12]
MAFTIIALITNIVGGVFHTILASDGENKFSAIVSAINWFLVGALLVILLHEVAA